MSFDCLSPLSPPLTDQPTDQPTDPRASERRSIESLPHPPATSHAHLTFAMASTAHRRLLQEYRALTNNPPDGITAGPVTEDDLLHWEALIQGPEGTPFEGGIFPAELKFPKDYPLAPPSMKFLGEIFHPNGEFGFALLGGGAMLTSGVSQQSIPTAWSAFRSCTPPVTIRTTTSTPRNAGAPSSPSRRY